MDELDAFYQHLDSERLLKDLGPHLVAEARVMLARKPDVRVAGMITTEDSPEAGPMRKALAKVTGRDVPEGLMVGIVPRPVVEDVLNKGVDDESWKEQSWQPQQVLPVVVSTRDGFRFGFFGLVERGGAEPG